MDQTSQPHPALARIYLDDIAERFRTLKQLADRAIDQIPAEALHRQPDEESNSVAVIIKHMAGNMRSRWTDFLTSDGEKPDRNRDDEFIDDGDTSALTDRWEEGWRILFAAVNGLREDDLTSTVFIRGEAHSVLEAVNRQLAHYAYHVGQIVYLCRMWREGEWTSLSIPRGASQAFNAATAAASGSSTG